MFRSVIKALSAARASPLLCANTASRVRGVWAKSAARDEEAVVEDEEAMAFVPFVPFLKDPLEVDGRMLWYGGAMLAMAA